MQRCSSRRAEPRQGSMTSHRTITPIAALLMALSAATAAPALAGSLLSGYGGPGQGSQAILGSALLNGPRGGGSSGTSGGSSDASGGAQGANGGAQSSANTGTPTELGSGAPGPSVARGRTTAAGPSRHAANGALHEGSAGIAESSAGVPSAYPASERAAAAQTSGVLGLSSTDILYTLLAFCMLAFTGGLTRRLARTATQEDTGANGMRRRTRLVN
jgi:hypothetical protein